MERRMAGLRSERSDPSVADRLQPGLRSAGGGSMRAVGRSGGRAVGALIAIAALVLTNAPRLLAQTMAITGGTVYPVSGPKIDHGTVTIRDGRIVQVGAGLAVPAG